MSNDLIDGGNKGGTASGTVGGGSGSAAPPPPSLVKSRDTKEKIDVFWSPKCASSQSRYDQVLAQGGTEEQALQNSVMTIDGNFMDLPAIRNMWQAEINYLLSKQSAGSGFNSVGGVIGGGGGGGGGSKNVPQKKPEPPPPPTSKLVSFGKFFCSFCLPALTGVAQEQGLDEVQINFYQLNESCGPISLHSIAEFPIEIDYAEAKFVAKAIDGGGESMTVFEFISWCDSELFNDKRAPGYGMRDIIEPETTDATKEKQKDDKSDAAKDSKSQTWFEQYGSLKLPTLAMKIDILYEGDNNKVDLLYKLQGRVGSQYNAPPPLFDRTTNQGLKRIMRVNLFDRRFDPHAKIPKVIQDESGRYRAFESDVSNDQTNEFVSKYAKDRDYAYPAGSPGVRTETSPTSNKVTYRLSDGKDVTVGPPFVSGKNVMKEFIGETVPKINVGINSTMVLNATFNSQISGLAGTLAMKNMFAKSTMAPNALSMAENNLPVRVSPGDLTLNTIGCPIGDIMQTFFVDFDTGTTLDNVYKVKSVQHNFALGKFETSWSFIYYDAYPTFFGAASVTNALKDLHKDTKEKKEQDEASGEQQPDPPPAVTSSQVNPSSADTTK